MPKLRIGCPLGGNFSDLAWTSMTVFDVRRLVFSLIVGGVLAALTAVAWRAVDPTSIPLGSASGAEVLWVGAILIVAHEAAHLLGFPGGGLNSKTIIGIWPKIGSPYVQYTAPMSRNRFILVLALPFLILSILPLTLVSVGLQSNEYISWISVINCLGAGSDLFILYKMLTVVPTEASVMESDGKVYWTQQLST